MATTVANMLTWFGYRYWSDDAQSVTATSAPSQNECLQWINEICSELLTVCVENKTEIGRSTASLTLADGTSTNTDLAATLLTPCEMLDKDGKKFCGWIEKTNVRNPLVLGKEADSINYDPAAESEPDRFYVNGANGIVFLNTPDAEYTAKIPYYAVHTILTLVTNTVPFMGIFDNVVIEALVMRAQNRLEYDLTFELKWFSYIRGQARKILSMRKSETVEISV